MSTLTFFKRSALTTLAASLVACGSMAPDYQRPASPVPAQFPVTGDVAAAKTLVGVRMKRAGARFSQHGGQTILLFRASLLSERFEALHRELVQSYAAPVKVAA